MLRSGVEIWPAFSLSINLRDLPLALVCGAVLIGAQVFLSRRERRWPGLVLPGLWFLGTLADLVPQAVRSWEARPGGTLEALGKALAIENVPALILLAVYVICRQLRRRRLRRQLRKSRIDDL